MRSAQDPAIQNQEISCHIIEIAATDNSAAATVTTAMHVGVRRRSAKAAKLTHSPTPLRILSTSDMNTASEARATSTPVTGDNWLRLPDQDQRRSVLLEPGAIARLMGESSDPSGTAGRLNPAVRRLSRA